MPKQIRFSKTDITKATIEVIRESGSHAVTARSISNRIGCSVTPLFREYTNMKEILDDALKEAERVFSDYMEDVLKYEPAFKELGIRLVRFAKVEQNLFNFMFLERSGLNAFADSLAHECLRSTGISIGLTATQADYIFEQIWPFTCGLAQLSSRNPEVYTDKRISEMLSTEFHALLMLVKSGSKVTDVEPRKIMIKRLSGREITAALDLAWTVFLDCIEPDLSQEGINEFHRFVTEVWKKAGMVFYGAFDGDRIIGMMGLRPHRHISLFFVEKARQGKGIGRSLFERVKSDLGGRVMTVNSAPSAVDVYQALGFTKLAEESTTNGIRHTPMRYGDCPCHRADKCPRSINCIECRANHKDSDKPLPCDK